MNPEIWHILIIGLSGILFALGGTWITDKIDGQKWIRRYLLPVTIGLILLILNIDWWRCLGLSLLSIGAFSLGYGDKADWWKWEGSRYPKWFTACMIPLPTLFIGFSPLIFAYPLFFLGMFYIGKWNWKIAEFAFGAGFGACVVGALSYKPF
jgi:hypothetical protein